MKKSNLHVLKTLPFFSGFDNSELSNMAESIIVRSYKKNVIVFNENDESTSIYFVLSGSLKVYLDNENGKEVILNKISEGESFGELALFCDSPRTATVATITSSKLLIISKSAFVEFYTNNTKAAQNIIKILANGIRKITKDVESFALGSVQERVLRALHDHAIDVGGRSVVNNLTHREIANLVASSRETVTRALRDLKKEGLIQLNEGSIEIQ